MTPDIVTLASALAAGLGLLVASHAYRGYRRHGSRAMGLLAVGIVCFTAIPFGFTALVGPALAWSDGLTLLAVVASYNVGLLAILYSLR
ncbi:hypothetical protein NGM10_13085 [Halorussus salilacus]|uniref:DUF7521 family protein n=1 Tax=Halorussus salilacus TaxID=2953750 RepID=UPI00209F23A9|nr:hypothetical protein [Halorussus salilacus]USZ67658.1 hypothetical protein NGM10_13085 [Halorussus salilacus]